MGVAAVGVLYATVRRWASPAAGLLAGAVLALTPGRDPDVPLQQPGRAARAADDARRLRHGPRPGARQLALADARGRARRLRLHDQDAAGVPRRAGVRARVPDRGADRTATPALARCAGRRRADRLVRLVGRRRGALAQEPPPVHRRFADQQRPRAHLRLQRLRPAHRQRDRERRARRRQAGGARPASDACSAPLGRPDRLAATGRARLRRRAAVADAGARHAPTAPVPRRPALGRHADRHAGRVQPRQGDHPRVLRGRAGAADRRARRHRRARPVASAARNLPRGSRWRRSSPAPQPGRSSCSTVRPSWNPWLRFACWPPGSSRACCSRSASGSTGASRWRRHSPGSSSPSRDRRPTLSKRRPRRTPARCPQPGPPSPAPVASAAAPRGGGFAQDGGGFARQPGGRHQRPSRRAAHLAGGNGTVANAGDGFSRRDPATAPADFSTRARPSATLVAALKKDSGHYTWVAATVGAQSAAGYQLADGDRR